MNWCSMQRARSRSQQHDFETEFARRMEHYRACSSKPVPTAR